MGAVVATGVQGGVRATLSLSSAPFTIRKQNPSFCSDPLGGSGPCSPHFLHQRFLLTLKDPTFQMKWHPVTQSEAHSATGARNQIPMTSLARRNTRHGSMVVTATTRGAGALGYAVCDLHSGIFIQRRSNEMVVSLCCRIRTSKQNLAVASGFLYLLKCLNSLNGAVISCCQTELCI